MEERLKQDIEDGDHYSLIPKMEGDDSSVFLQGQGSANARWRAGREYCSTIHHFSADFSAGFHYEWERLNKIKANLTTLEKKEVITYPLTIEIDRNNSENRRKLFNTLYLMATGSKPKTHNYSEVVEYMRSLN